MIHKLFEFSGSKKLFHYYKTQLISNCIGLISVYSKVYKRYTHQTHRRIFLPSRFISKHQSHACNSLFVLKYFIVIQVTYIQLWCVSLLLDR
jgi:hypothetical protein